MLLMATEATYEISVRVIDYGNAELKKLRNFLSFSL
jgi:hypothetical protein